MTLSGSQRKTWTVLHALRAEQFAVTQVVRRLQEQPAKLQPLLGRLGSDCKPRSILFFNSILSPLFFFFPKAWEEGLVTSAWMQGEWGCPFSLRCYLLQVADIIQLFLFFPLQCKKIKTQGRQFFSALSHSLLPPVLWTGFIYLYSYLTTEMHQLVFRGFLLKKASYPVIRMFKTPHTQQKKRRTRQEKKLQD